MLRLVSAVFRDNTKKTISAVLNNFGRNEANLISPQVCCFSAITNQFQCSRFTQKENVQEAGIGNNILSNSLKKLLMPQVPISVVPCRTVIKYSMNKGKRRTEKEVPMRFFRLNWGIWIRTKAGRHKHLWKKSSARKRRLRQHVFCNATQSWLLDKMVTKYWKRPKYWVDDIYEPYHTRENFRYSQTKPKPIPEDDVLIFK